MRLLVIHGHPVAESFGAALAVDFSWAVVQIAGSNSRSANARVTA